MDKTNEPQNEDTKAEQAAPQGPVCYSKYNEGKLDFDPLKELNLPANYNEVIDRFKKLQGDRAMESLN